MLSKWQITTIMPIRSVAVEEFRHMEKSKKTSSVIKRNIGFFNFMHKCNQLSAITYQQISNFTLPLVSSTSPAGSEALNFFMIGEHALGNTLNYIKLHNSKTFLL
jgi:hypothetical protein